MSANPPRAPWSLAATVDEVRPRPRDNPRAFLATDVIIVDKRSGELVVVGSRAALEGYRVAAPQLPVHLEGLVTVGSIDLRCRAAGGRSLADVARGGRLLRRRSCDPGGHPALSLANEHVRGGYCRTTSLRVRLVPSACVLLKPKVLPSSLRQ